MYTTENRFIDYVTQKHIGQIGTITKSDLKSDFASAYDAKISAMPSFLVPNKRVLVEECCHDIPMLALKLLGHQKKHERIVAHEHRRFLGKRLALDYTRHPDLRANLYGRVDFVMSNALPKVIELNIGSPNGGWEILVYEPLYRQLNVVVDYLAHHTKEQWQTRNTLFIQFMTMVQSVIAKGLNGQSKVNFLLLLDAELIDAGIEPLLAGLSAQLSQAVNQQVNLHCFSDTQLFIEENQLLTVNGEVIHCLLDGQFEQRCDIPDFVHQLFLNDKLIWPDNPVMRALNDKRLLAALYQAKDSEIYTAKEREQIENYVPWGCMLEQSQVIFQGHQWQLERLLSEHKDHFVIKKGLSNKGADVCIGKYVTLNEWLAFIAAVDDKSEWVVQQYCETEQTLAAFASGVLSPAKAVWGSFSCAGEYAGSFVRFIEEQENNQGIINSDRGAWESIVFEVTENESGAAVTNDS